MDAEQHFSEDEYILNDDDEQSTKLPISEMPSTSSRKTKRKSKKGNKLKKSKKSKKNKSKSNKKKKRPKKKISAKLKKFSFGPKDKAGICIPLDQKMKSIALLDPMDELITVKHEQKTDDLPIEENSSPSSSTLLDEIMRNQTKIFVPSNLLKINRDGTFEETECFNRYMERKNKKCSDASREYLISDDKDRSIISARAQKKILPKPQYSNQMTTPNAANVNSNLINWHNEGQKSDSLKAIQLPCSLPPPSHLNISQQLSQQNHPHQQSFLMANPNLALLGRLSILEGQNHHILNSTIPLNLFNNIRANTPQSHQPNLLQMPPPHLLNMLGGGQQQQQHKPPLMFEQINTAHQQQQCIASKVPTPIPPPLPPTTIIIDPLIPPPPPPPHQIQSSSRCGLDSPMDIECDEASAKNNKSRNKRSRSVQIADELMKRALKPYFMRRKITKNEYKDIMKRGVAKLSKRESLRPEKVEKFVEKYVNSIVKERMGKQFH